MTNRRPHKRSNKELSNPFNVIDCLVSRTIESQAEFDCRPRCHDAWFSLPQSLFPSFPEWFCSEKHQYLIQWLIDCLFVCLIDWLIDWMVGCDAEILFRKRTAGFSHLTMLFWYWSRVLAASAPSSTKMNRFASRIKLTWKTKTLF